MKPKKKPVRQLDGQKYSTVQANVDNDTFNFDESNIIIPKSKKQQEDIKITSIEKSINIAKLLDQPTPEDVLCIAAKVAAFIAEK